MEVFENTPLNGQELEGQTVDKIPVESKLIVAAENHVIDPHSLLYAALPPSFNQPARKSLSLWRQQPSNPIRPLSVHRLATVSY